MGKKVKQIYALSRKEFEKGIRKNLMVSKIDANKITVGSDKKRREEGKLDPQKIEQITLEKIKYGLKKYISPAQLRDLKVKSYKDDFTNSIVVEIRDFVYGRKIKKEVTKVVRYPSNWVQAVKERFLPEFIRRRFPVKYKCINAVTVHYHICPHLNVVSQGEHLNFLAGREKEEEKEGEK